MILIIEANLVRLSLPKDAQSIVALSENEGGPKKRPSSEGKMKIIRDLEIHSFSD